MKRIMVTGALGHIGSRLIRDLPRAFPDARFDLLDNLSTQRYCSLFDLPPGGKYRFIEEDVMTDELERRFAGVDVVVHLAAATDAASSVDKPEHYEHVNYVGTERVARACAATGSRLLFLSTTSVYGSQEAEVDESCPIAELKPQSPYAIAKLKAEQMLARLAESEGLRCIICRYGTIFGVSAGMRFHTAVNKFCWQAVMGQPLTVWRSALHQMRPYLELGDATAAISTIIAGDWFDGTIYNVVTANQTVNDIITSIRNEIPDVHVDYVDSRIMNQLSYTVRSDRFCARGFAYTGSIDRGIAETIDIIRSANRGG